MDLDLFTTHSYMAQCPVLEIHENTFQNIEQICQVEFVSSANSEYTYPDVFEIVWDKTLQVPIINVRYDFYRIIAMSSEEASKFTLRMLLSTIGLDGCVFRMDMYKDILIHHILDTVLQDMPPLQFSLYSSEKMYTESKEKNVTG